MQAYTLDHDVGQATAYSSYVPTISLQHLSERRGQVTWTILNKVAIVLLPPFSNLTVFKTAFEGIIFLK